MTLVLNAATFLVTTIILHIQMSSVSVLFVKAAECLKDLAKQRNVSVTFSFLFCFLFDVQTGEERLKIKEPSVTTGNRKTLTTKP